MWKIHFAFDLFPYVFPLHNFGMEGAKFGGKHKDMRVFLSTFGSILPGGDTPAIRPFCNLTVTIVRLQTGHFEGSRSEASPSYTNFSAGVVQSATLQ